MIGANRGRLEPMRCTIGISSRGRAFEINSKAEVALAAAKDIRHLNCRLASDAFATLYVLGRALSASERGPTLVHLRSISGVRRAADYIAVWLKGK